MPSEGPAPFRILFSHSPAEVLLRAVVVGGAGSGDGAAKLTAGGIFIDVGRGYMPTGMEWASMVMKYS